MRVKILLSQKVFLWSWAGDFFLNFVGTCSIEVSPRVSVQVESAGKITNENVRQRCVFF